MSEIETETEAVTSTVDEPATVDAIEAPSIDEDLSKIYDEQNDEATSVEKEVKQPEINQNTPEVPKEEDIEPPVSWTKLSKEEFKKLPTQLKQELRKREDDITRGFQEAGLYKRAIEQLNQRVAPYQARLKAMGVDLPTAVERLLNYDHVLAYGSPQDKANAAKSLIKAYGIDPTAIQSEEQQYVDPDIAELRQRLGNTEQMLAQERAAMQQRHIEGVKRLVVDEFTQFANDKSNKYFEKVRGDMAKLVQTGAATSLKEAYERAVWNNPEVRAELVEEQKMAKVQEEKNRSQAARRTASTNVKSNAVSSNGLNLSIDEDLERVWNSMNSR